MFLKLQPDLYFPSILAIDLKLLKEKGIKGLICDIDNTIVPWSEKKVVQEVMDWFQELKKQGFQICLVSNGTDQRVNFFSRELDLPAVGQAIKPAKRAFKLAQQFLQLSNEEIAVIGDQIFTDVLGGNRMDFLTILVDPMSEKELFTTKLMRLLEKLFFTREG